jgi:hypothetical protein
MSWKVASAGWHYFILGRAMAASNFSAVGLPAAGIAIVRSVALRR